MSPPAASCVLCGAPVNNKRGSPSWARQFRAVYADDETPNEAHLSGTGERQQAADVVYLSPPEEGSQLDPFKVHLMRSSFATETRPQEASRWGFPFHCACWDILNSISPRNQKRDTQAILDLCRSYPVQRGILNFGHDYDGCVQTNPYDMTPLDPTAGDDSWLVRGMTPGYMMSDPLRVPGLRDFFQTAEDGGPQSYPTVDHACEIDPIADAFSELPATLLETILLYLPSPDVIRLKQASRVFANVALTDPFWRSRFLPGRELGSLFESDRHLTASSLRGQWKRLFFSARKLDSDAHVMNRKRVWNLALSLDNLLDKVTGSTCDGQPVRSLSEPHAVADYMHWETASRSLKPATSAFTSGSRSLCERITAIPYEVEVVFVSTVEVYGRTYISGIRLQYHGGYSSKLGYIRPQTEYPITWPVSSQSPIAGFHLAQDERGIRGLAVLSSGDDVSNWIGDYEGFPKRRLALTSASEGLSVGFLKGGFDALKLVSLSISDGGSTFGRYNSLDNGQTLRNSRSWLPEIPDRHLSFPGIRTPQAGEKHDERPWVFAKFGGNKGENLEQVRSITVWTGKVKFVQCIEVHLDTPGGGTETVRLGSKGDGEGSSDLERTNFEIDSLAGERMAGLDAYHMNFGWLFGFKVFTNWGRTAMFPPSPIRRLGNYQCHVKTFHPEDGTVVGFCSVQPTSRWGITDIGLVVNNSFG